jgi:hypothetical protein
VANYVPKVTEQNDEYVFELRDGVFVAARFASEKKLRFSMWRKDILLPSEEGNIFVQSFRDRLVQQARDKFNTGKQDLISHIEEDIGAVAIVLGYKGDDGKSIHDKLQEKEGPSITERLITITEDAATLFHSPEKVAHAACRREDHVEVYELESREFRMWLRSEFRRRERKRLEEAALADRERVIEAAGAMVDEDLADAPIQVPRPPAVPPQAITIAVGELQASAVLNGKEEEVHLRVAGSDGKIYVDLCNAAWEAVEISEEGWRIAKGDEIPVRFVRSNIMKQLPYPTAGGSVDELRHLLTLGGDSYDARGS